MIAHVIGFVLQNLPALLFVVALVVAAARRRHGPAAERLLSWILLLPIGVTGLWAGAFHVFFPAIAAKLIGWDVSPFQLEVGMADLAIGATACIAFWGDLNFKAAAVSAASIFLLGDAVGPGFAVSGQAHEICGLYQRLAEDGFRACIYAAAGVWAASITARSCLGADIPSFFSSSASSEPILVR